MSHANQLMTTQQAAKFLNVSESFLAKARMKGTGPRYRKLGNVVRYAAEDLDAYLKSRGRTCTAEA